MLDEKVYTLEKFKESQRRLSLKGSSRNTSSTIAAERSGDVYQEVRMVTRLLMYLFRMNLRF
jgi:hypothetical protein